MIVNFDIPLPGRKHEEETRLYTKQDYESVNKKDHGKKEAPVYASEYEEKAVYFLEGLGGKENIKDVTNCATRLRITVIDPSLVKDRDYFTENKLAHGMAKSGQSIQIIVGLSVPQVRESFETKLSLD